MIAIRAVPIETADGALRALAVQVAKVVSEALSSGHLQPDVVPYSRWRLTSELQYGPTGVQSKTATLERYEKQVWLRAYAAVFSKAMSAGEFQTAVDVVSGQLEGKEPAQQFVRNFVQNLTRRFFEPEPHPVDVAPLVDQALRELSGEAFRCGAEVQLLGIALEDDEIRLAPWVTLRRPTREDFEREVPDYGPLGVSMFDRPDPSAIANVELLARRPLEVQRQIEKLIAILRLFKVGSVQYSAYEFSPIR